MLFLKEDIDVEVEIGVFFLLKYIVGESKNVELFKEVDEEFFEESRWVLLCVEEGIDVFEVEIDIFFLL